MTTSTRRNCLEVPATDAERATYKDFAKEMGMAFAVFARLAMFQFIDLHDARKLGPKESRACRDAPIASRASVKRLPLPALGHRHNVRSSFGGAARPIRV